MTPFHQHHGSQPTFLLFYFFFLLRWQSKYVQGKKNGRITQHNKIKCLFSRHDTIFLLFWTDSCSVADYFYCFRIKMLKSVRISKNLTWASIWDKSYKTTINRFVDNNARWTLDGPLLRFRKRTQLAHVLKRGENNAHI